MALASGVRLGPYEVLAPLGAGGMGEVYRARDTRLERTVAIKVLPSALADDPDRRVRFEREAKAVAALDHPHICGIHDVGEAGGTHYLVMPLVEGQTLADRLVKGPLPLAQALQIASEMADALASAHRHGIIHRDLKPANVMLTKTGAKLLDFGLAKLRAPGGPVSLSGTTEAITGAADTARGTILGTVHYMAPEQVEGRELDARADIWALGAVLYEMVTGTRAFVGDTAASVIGAILKDTPPPVSARQPLSPPALDLVVARCLDKDRDDRWQHMADVQHGLTLVRTGLAGGEATRSAPEPPWRRLLPFTAALALAAATGVGAWTWRSPPAVPARDVRFSIYPEHGSEFSVTTTSVVAAQFALSPDGSQLAFVATAQGQPMLWVRRFDSLTARMLDGTQEAVSPFWSPDSRALAFFAQGRLKTVRLDGGAPVVLADSSLDPRGGTWGRDGTILAAITSNGGITRFAPDGRPTVVLPVDVEAGETALRWPAWLSDGRHFIVLARFLEDRYRGVYLGSLDTKTRTLLVGSDWAAGMVSDQLLFLRGSTLMVQPLDLAKGQLTGEPVPLVDGVSSTTNGYSGFSVSPTGTLAYASPWPTEGALVWFDRAGRQLGPPVAPRADYIDLAIAPDGERVAVSRVDRENNTGDIWLIDPARQQETRLTANRFNDAGPRWTPDGTRIYFRSNRRGINSVFVKPVNGSCAEELVFELTGPVHLQRHHRWPVRRCFHALFSTFGQSASWDVWALALTPSPSAKPLLQGPFNEFQSSLSPDGRWIAFVSNETGQQQIVVQSYPAGDQRVQISARGGSDPVWAPDGRELFFIGASRELMAAPFDNGRAGVPTLLFRTRVPLAGNPYRTPYAVAPDGKRFLVNTAPDDVPPPAIHVVLDWRALLPAER
ncbi:MAG: protein kinase [Vicinamibacterales bacterium]